MATHPPRTPGGGVERFFEDLRSYDDRRSREERRQVDRPVPFERRLGMERRMGADRRARAVPSFSSDDVLEIVAIVGDPVARAACPHCDGQLMLGPAFRRGELAVRRVQCTRCHRGTEIDVGG